MLGKTISHYKILEKIGQGGTGEDTNLGCEVAIKNRRLPMILRLSRRKFWRDLAVGVASVAMCVPAFGQDETIRTQTYTSLVIWKSNSMSTGSTMTWFVQWSYGFTAAHLSTATVVG